MCFHMFFFYIFVFFVYLPVFLHISVYFSIFLNISYIRCLGSTAGVMETHGDPIWDSKGPTHQAQQSVKVVSLRWSAMVAMTPAVNPKQRI